MRVKATRRVAKPQARRDETARFEGALWRLGVDVGGTFTDFVLLNPATGEVRTWKVLTTPEDPSLAIAEGTRARLAEGPATARVAPRAVALVAHATTLVTNAVIERKGVLIAFVTTAGFRDTVFMGREYRYDMQDLFLDFPSPLVPRRQIYEVPERIGADGEVLEPLDEAGVREAARRAAEAGVQAVAVGFLHSYKNPAHEERAATILHDAMPDVLISASSQISPVIREYERFSTVLANAYVQPLIRPYLTDLEGRLADLGVKAPLLIMLSSGGLAEAADAGRFPVRMIESGPAAGVMGAAHLARRRRLPRVLAFDMGGTTAKGALIENARPSITFDFEVARIYRFKRGSGLPIKSPTVDLIEVGAGGGSIARVDALGVLRVGPDSSGAAPGPVCYGRGGRDATVTDANAVLGYLNAAGFAGGAFALDVEAARSAVADQVGRPLKLDVARAAWGVHTVVNENMANAVRVHAVERGRDLRGFTLMGFGGCGPVHACRVADILHVDEVLLPFGASVFSAIGLLVTPVSFEFIRTYHTQLDALDWDRVNALLIDAEARGAALLARAGVDTGPAHVERRCEMRYLGQQREVSVPVPLGRLVPQHAQTIRRGFERVYRALYTETVEAVPIEVLDWRVKVSGQALKFKAPRPGPRLARQQLGGVPGRGSTARETGRRQMYLPEGEGFRRVPVYSWPELLPGEAVTGPCCVDSPDTTVVVPPWWRLAVLDGKDLRLTRVRRQPVP